ncbi:MAG TPA: penicillin-binding transpeptidase domain-containing protein, partial [Polyangiaceae bacterium]|nr:penicillin-binding transpeptidase domain-containing protein [Polyangiaceae bacterium]
MRAVRVPALLLLFLSSLGGVPLAVAEPGASSPAADLRHIRITGGVATAKAGNHGQVELTLNAELQQAAQDLLAEAGAVDAAIIVVDARTSELIVYAERSQHARSSTLLTTARAPAASVFKLVTTAALFETTTLTPNEEVCTLGGERAIERRHLDAPKQGDMRCAPFSQALGHSRNA